MAEATRVRKEYAVPLPRGYPAERIRISVSIPPVSADGRPVRFSEHVLAADRLSSSRRIIATTTGGFFASDDLGVTWDYCGVRGFHDDRFVNAYTLPTGEICLQAGNTTAAGSGDPRSAARVIVCDSDGTPLSVFHPAADSPTSTAGPWHGTSSVDYACGTLMYAEYPSNTGTPNAQPRLPSRVFRTRDRGASWETVFELPGSEIRHFHLLRADPSMPRTWWLASGDLPSECRVWKTADDGDSWDDVTAVFPHEFNVGESHFTRAVFRLTDIAFPDDKLLWGTDDVLGMIDPRVPRSKRGGSRIFETPRREPFALREIGYCGQAVRNVVDCGDFYVLITQGIVLQYSTRPAVFALFKGSSLPCVRLFDVDNYGPGTTSFSASRASRFANDGVFFSYRGKKDVFDHPTNLLKWTVFVD